MFKASMLNVALLLSLGFSSSVLFASSYTLPSGEVLEDPTRPPMQAKARTKAPVTEYKLSYILNSSARRYAVINGQRVSEGDRIGSAKVRRIDAQSVSLEEQGRVRTLSLKTIKGIRKNP